MKEQTVTESVSSSLKIAQPGSPALPLNSLDVLPEERYHTGSFEFDRVLGGGLVKGSLVLVGGDPGIGKSTLLLQICQSFKEELKILYVSGEESKHQIKLRADRLGVTTDKLLLLTETDLNSVLGVISSEQPDVVIIDSVQTMCKADVNSAPGSVTQIRECTNAFMHMAKEQNISVFLVGHVNKEGALAGPKVLEHIVDAVVYFEGERQQSYRVLRAAKNRFGSTNEIGVFEMTGTGLEEVSNPSKMLLEGRPKDVSGTCVTCVMEGTRPLLAEVQALITPSGYGNSRRMAAGMDYNRMALLLAVLEKRANLALFNQDAYINVIGGIRLDEPGADLAVCLAVASGFSDFVIPEDILAVGEVGLGGEIRAIHNMEQRILEAARLGFKRILLPARCKLKESEADIEVLRVSTLKQAIYYIRSETSPAGKAK